MLRHALQLLPLLFFCVIATAQENSKLSFETINEKIATALENKNLKEALHYTKQGQEKAQLDPGTQDTTYAQYSNQLGELYYLTAKFDLAKSAYIEAKNAYLNAAATESAGYASTLGNLALLYKKTKHFDLAEPLYLESKDIYAKIYSNVHPEYLFVVSNLANLYASNNQLQAAETLLLENKQNILLSLGKKHPSYLSNINSLASTYSRMKRYKKAEALYLEAKGLYEKKAVPTAGYASVLNNLGLLYVNIGALQKAADLFTLAEAVKEKDPYLDRPLHVSFLKNFAFIYLQLDQPELALQKLQKGLYYASGLELSMNVTNNWADSILNVEHASTRHLQKTLEVLKILTNYLAKSGQVKQELLVCNLGIQLIEKKQKDLLSSKDKLRFLSKNIYWAFRSLMLLDPATDAPKAFELAEQNKSILLLNASKSEQKYRLGNLPDSLILQEKTLLKKRSKIKAKLIENRSQEEKANLRTTLIDLDQQMERFKSYIKTNYPKYAHLKYENTNIQAKDIQTLLDDKTAVIEYVLTPSTMHVFYIDQTSVKWHKKAINSKQLNAKIDSLHQVLSDYKSLAVNPKNSYQELVHLSHWFYKNLVAEIMAEAPTSIDHLIFIPDAKLGHLPFETFLVKNPIQDKETNYNKLPYLLKDYTISYNFSAALWKENQQISQRNNNGSILGIAAAYDYEVNPNRLSIYQKIRKSLPPLPAAQKELSALEEYFAGTFLNGLEASEKNFKAQAGDYAVIHLAMHGILDRKRPILSSLAFSEDNDSLENNFLQAHEISKLQLNSDLVVLSACETGYGKFEQGNGIASLARSFMYAGSASLVVSLWQVNDYSTSEIMQVFYQNLAKGMDKAAALRAAKLFFIEHSEGLVAHPAFWSPFIQIGNTQAIHIQPKSKGYLFWGLGGLALLILGGLVWKKQQQRAV